MKQIQENIKKCFAYLSFLLELSKGNQLSGYDVLVHVKRFGMKVSPGTVYNQIKRLEEEGIVKGAKHVTGKTVYEMTENGMELFKEFKENWVEPIRYIYQNIVD